MLVGLGYQDGLDKSIPKFIKNRSCAPKTSRSPPQNPPSASSTSPGPPQDSPRNPRPNINPKSTPKSTPNLLKTAPKSSQHPLNFFVKCSTKLDQMPSKQTDVHEPAQHQHISSFPWGRRHERSHCCKEHLDCILPRWPFHLNISTNAAVTGQHCGARTKDGQRQTDRHRQTRKQTGRQTQTDGQTDRQTDSFTPAGTSAGPPPDTEGDRQVR